MSKSITIPASMGNRVTVTINGTSYTYATGTAVTVPDEVASEIENLIAEWPVDNRKSAADEEHDIQVKLTPFIVEMTPTAADFSGTMDATVGEIYAAWSEGRRILFKVGAVYADVSTVSFGDGYDYPSFEGYVVDPSESIMIYAFTGFTDSADTATYSTALYTLTPVSSGS